MGETSGNIVNTHLTRSVPETLVSTIDPGCLSVHIKTHRLIWHHIEGSTSQGR